MANDNKQLTLFSSILTSILTVSAVLLQLYGIILLKTMNDQQRIFAAFIEKNNVLTMKFCFLLSPKVFLLLSVILYLPSDQQQHERKNVCHDNSRAMIFTNLVSRAYYSFTNLAHGDIKLNPG